MLLFDLFENINKMFKQIDHGLHMAHVVIGHYFQ